MKSWTISRGRKERDGFPLETKLANRKFQKGLQGEMHVTQKLAELGFKILFVGGCQKYSMDGNSFYCVDLLPFGKGEVFWVQVKNKEPRKFYPDTGLELWRYKNLIQHQKESGKPVLLLFTDSSKKIYGEWVSNLQGCVSPHGGRYNSKDKTEMIYFLVKKMRSCEDLLAPYEIFYGMNET